MKAGTIGQLGDVTNYFKHSEETVSGVCRILSTQQSLSSFYEESTRSEVREYHPGKLLKQPASQSPSKNCRRRRRKKMRRVDESIE